MKLFNKEKKEEQKEIQKKENRILKFVKDHKVALGYAALLCAAFAGGYISPRRRTHVNDTIDLANASDTEFGQPRYGIGIDDAFATVLYSDGDVDFVGKDYLMNLAEEIVKQRNNEKEESHEQI